MGNDRYRIPGIEVALVKRINSPFYKIAAEGENIATHKDEGITDACVWIIHPACAAVKLEKIRIPGSQGVSCLRGKHTIPSATGRRPLIISQKPAISFLVIDHVGVIQAAGTRRLAKEVGCRRWPEEERAAFVVDSYSYVHCYNKMIWPGGHFRIRRHVTATTTALCVVNAGEAQTRRGCA